MTNLFLTYLGISATVGIVVLLILLASPFINRRYAAKWKYYIWIFLAVRLLIPISGIYHAESKSPAPVVSDIGGTSGEVVYEPAEAQEVLPRRFVVEIPVGTVGQISQTPDLNSEKPKLSLFDIAFAAWIAGAIIFASVPLFSCFLYKYKITHSGRIITDGEVFKTLRQTKSRLKIKQNVSLIRYGKAASPMIIGFIRPVLVLPCDEYSQEELQFIIRHELIHLKRGDVYIKLLCVLANALHWFNPLIWIMRKEMAIDMELSCDEGVIKGADFGVKKAYTETLMSSLRRQSSKRSSLTTQFYGGKGTMKKRFTNILGKGGKKNGAAVLICAVVLATLLGVLVGCTQNSSIPSDDELVRLINNYLEFEAICTYTNLPVDFDNPPSDDPSSQEHWIYPVTKEGMTTWADWQSYLGGIFAESGVEKALEKTATRYINYNGNLYYSDGGMGWHLSNEYCIARTKQNGSTAFTVEFWREYDPDFGISDEREFRITTLSFEYTSAGWRITDYSNRDSAPTDSNPNLAGYNPYGTEGNAPADEAVTPLTDDEMNRLIYDYRRFEVYAIADRMDLEYYDPVTGESLLLDNDSDSPYYPSKEEGLTTWQEWLDYINGLFTPETAAQKLDELTGEGNQYLNVDGMVYVYDVGGMGWSYGSPVQAAYKTDGSDGVIEFWREHGNEGEEGVYRITVLRIKLTDAGWRIQSAEDYDTYSAIEGYQPILDKPEPKSLDDATALANEIYKSLERDYRTTVDILTMHMTEPINIVEGVDQIGNLREIDGVTYVPMIEDYDTIDEIMEVLRRVYTEEKCDTLYSHYLDTESTGFMKEVDGKLYAMAIGEQGHNYFNLPITSASAVGDSTIFANTTITYDFGDVPYEITFRYEYGQWKIDELYEYINEEGRELSY